MVVDMWNAAGMVRRCAAGQNTFMLSASKWAEYLAQTRDRVKLFRKSHARDAHKVYLYMGDYELLPTGKIDVPTSQDWKKLTSLVRCTPSVPFC